MWESEWLLFEAYSICTCNISQRQQNGLKTKCITTPVIVQKVKKWIKWNQHCSCRKLVRAATHIFIKLKYPEAQKNLDFARTKELLSLAKSVKLPDCIFCDEKLFLFHEPEPERQTKNLVLWLDITTQKPAMMMGALTTDISFSFAFIECLPYKC